MLHALGCDPWAISSAWFCVCAGVGRPKNWFPKLGKTGLWVDEDCTYLARISDGLVIF